MYSIEKRHENCHEDAIWTVDWLKNSEDSSSSTKRLITGSLDDTVKIWSYNEKEGGELNCIKTLSSHHNLGVLSVASSPNAKFFASSSLDSNISLWDGESYELVKKIEGGPLETWTLNFTRDSNYLLTGHYGGLVDMYSVESGKKIKSLDTKQKLPLSIATSPDGKWIGCGSTNGLVSLLDGESGSHFKTLEGHAMPVRSLSFSPDSKLLLTASDDKHIKIYSMSDFQVVGTISGHKSWVLSVCFSPDGSCFASSSSDKSVRIWDIGSRACLNIFNEAHSDQVWEVGWGSDTKLVSVGEDRNINLYNIVK